MWPIGKRSQGSRSKVTRVKVKYGVQTKAGGLTSTSSCFICTMFENTHNVIIMSACLSWSFEAFLWREILEIHVAGKMQTSIMCVQKGSRHFLQVGCSRAFPGISYACHVYYKVLRALQWCWYYTYIHYQIGV